MLVNTFFHLAGNLHPLEKKDKKKVIFKYVAFMVLLSMTRLYRYDLSRNQKKIIPFFYEFSRVLKIDSPAFD